MPTKVQIVFYSTYGHVHHLAERSRRARAPYPIQEVELLQVPKSMSDEALKRTGADQARAGFAHAPVATVSTSPRPTRSSSAPRRASATWPPQMRNFLDHTGGLWAKNTLVGKVGSVFTSSSGSTRHGGQETTITFIPHDAPAPRHGDRGRALFPAPN